MKINLLDYKGKHYIYQDADIFLDGMDWVEDTIDDVNNVTDEDYKEHYWTSRYYGIPAYIGKDERLNELDKKYELEYNEQEQPHDV